MNKKHCVGCYCDPYNYGLGGSNECWSLKSAKLVKKKEVSIDQRPPWNQKARTFPDCYHKQRYVYVDPERTC